MESTRAMIVSPAAQDAGLAECDSAVYRTRKQR
jgi:hypothetical protein